MLAPEHAREMPVGRYREISRLSRDLVGRAVLLDGGARGSGGLGPVTLSSRQVVREGPGRVPGRRELFCARLLVSGGRADRLSCATLLPPRAPATCRELPAGRCPSPARPPPPPSAEFLDSSCPVTLSPDILTFQSPVAAVSFPSLPTERIASLVSGRHLTTHLSIGKFLATLPVDSNFWQCLGVLSPLTVSEVRIKSLFYAHAY